MIIKSQLYLQARDQIFELMRAYQPGDQLPPEAALSKKLGVSRNTVRDALMSLERDGFIIRRHGIGTFVASKPMHLGTTLNEFIPIPDLISASGYEPAMRDLEVDLQVAPGEICQPLKVPESEYLQTARVLFLADKRPVVFVTYYLSPKLRGEAMNWNEFRGSMGSFIESSLNTRIHQSHARISAVAAPEAVAQKLEVQEGSPVLKFITVGYSADGFPAYGSISYQDSNLLEVNAIRFRKGAGTSPG